MRSRHMRFPQTALAALVLAALAPRGAEGEVTASVEEAFYWIVDFEREDGFGPGPVPESMRGLDLAEGRAEIMAGEPPRGQWLRLLAHRPVTVMRRGTPHIPGCEKVHLSAWARPVATSGPEAAEFIDFDGALIAFVRSEDGRSGIVHVCHSVSESEGYWVSTGISAALDGEGRPVGWLYFEVILHQPEDRWELLVNEQLAAKEIGAFPPDRPDGNVLWLFGAEDGATDIDQLYVGSVPLRELAERAVDVRVGGELKRHFETVEVDPSGPMTVLSRRTMARGDARAEMRAAAADPTGAKLHAPEEFEFGVKLATGTREIEPIEIPEAAKDRGDKKPGSAFIFGREFGADGKPLPVKLVIEVDPVIKPGDDLRAFGWVVRLDDPGTENHGELIAWGNFARSFRAAALIPEKYIAKRFTISVGQLTMDVRKPGEGPTAEELEHAKKFQGG